MKKLTISLLAALCLVPQFSDARLGESEKECIERYGEVIERGKPLLESSDEETLVFSKDSIGIEVEMKGGRAWRISFRKSNFSDAQTKALLEANSAGSQWRDGEEFGGRKFWITITKSGYAALFKLKSTLEFRMMTDEYLDGMKERYEKLLNDASAAEEFRKDKEEKVEGAPKTLEGF